VLVAFVGSLISALLVDGFGDWRFLLLWACLAAVFTLVYVAVLGLAGAGGRRFAMSRDARAREAFKRRVGSRD
jgi:hypothetical protein